MDDTTDKDKPAGAAAALPAILCGPVLRHVGPREFTLWMVTPQYSALRLQLFAADGRTLFDRPLAAAQQRCVQVGRHCFIQLIHVTLDQPLAENGRVEYDLLEQVTGQSLWAALEGLCYAGRSRPGFYSRRVIDNLLHGSCRKPHNPGGDAMLRVDALLEQAQGRPDSHPDLLLFSGDQIYADDVSGPMLVAIHQLIERLGLYDEHWDGAMVGGSQALFASPYCYYRRDSLLPKNRANQKLTDMFFRGARKPIFTAASAHNHLVSLSEVIAMYLLAWSPACWPLVDLEAGLPRVPDSHRELYRRECGVIGDFAAGLGRVRRALAHVPVYMIFDDHDITDDWNLTRGWEEAAYGHPFSRRILGNALTAYCLCQGWGNRPDNLAGLEQALRGHFTPHGIADHDGLIDRVLDWEHWHYRVDTQPKIVVLDTRTRRWRSESSAARPSGLMDWEALSELQQELIGQEAVILVSPAPVFGVKFIEVVQRLFAWFGKALVVDAENWMAHRGAASVILNIFRHPRTPPNFLILSGDVHYSFVYDVTLRFRKQSPKITQVTASGIKNCFPIRLLRCFDRINRLLFGEWSPLNWLTRRRRMLIERRRPTRGGLWALYNGSAIGQVILRDGGREVEACIHTCDEGRVDFKPKNDLAT